MSSRLARRERPVQLAEQLPLLAFQRQHEAEIDHAQPAVVQHEEVARMEVDVEHPPGVHQPIPGPQQLRATSFRSSCDGSRARNSVRCTPSSRSIVSTRDVENCG